MNREQETGAKTESPLINEPSVNNNISPTFCVAMLKNGTTVKIEGKVEEFSQTLKDADFAWINVQVDDLKEDGSKIAGKLEFKPSIVQELVLQRFSGYDDHTQQSLGYCFPRLE